jgi:hypothetical protein
MTETNRSHDDTTDDETGEGAGAEITTDPDDASTFEPEEDPQGD